MIISEDFWENYFDGGLLEIPPECDDDDLDRILSKYDAELGEVVVVDLDDCDLITIEGIRTLLERCEALSSISIVNTDLDPQEISSIALRDIDIREDIDELGDEFEDEDDEDWEDED